MLLSTSSSESNQIIISLNHEYELRLFGTKKVNYKAHILRVLFTDCCSQAINSVILISLDSEDKIIHLEDQWNGDEASSGWCLGTLRRANGRITPWIVRVPKGIAAAKSKSR